MATRGLRAISYRVCQRYYCTVNFVGLFPVPPGVVMEIVTAPAGNPAGTTAVTCESDFTVNVVAFTVPNFTALV